MSAKPETTDGAKPPAKSKKLLVIIIAVVLVLVLAGVGAFVFITKQRAAANAEDGEPVAVAHAAAPKTPPAYLPLDPMVVNLADPGGERVAQIGITLVVADAHASDTVKAYLPTIRSAVLLLISQRTAEELLKQEGKEKLAKDILREASVPFGGGAEEEVDPAATPKKKQKAHAEYPVSAVLFSGFIVQ